MTLRETVFRDPDSYFHHYAALSADEAREDGARHLDGDQPLNLRENILPTRERAHLVLDKSQSHAVRAHTVAAAVRCDSARGSIEW